jgi:D-arabinose 5-phosphate isomerase GutQ
LENRVSFGSSLVFEVNYMNNTDKMDKMEEIRVPVLAEAVAIEADALYRGYSRVTPEAFDAAVSALMSCSTVAASGCGHSGYVLDHFVHLLNCAEIPARFISTNDATHGEMGFVSASSVMVIASRGGRTQELLPIQEIARSRGAKIIVVTENEDSPLAKGADIVLLVSITREIDPHNVQGTTSFTVFSVLFDAIQCEILRRKGGGAEAFAEIHPGGAVGERLTK